MTAQETSISDDDLLLLEDFIYGRGQYHFLGQGITTHPDGDENNKNIHRACLELERRGRIVKSYVDAHIVTWKPVNLRRDS